MQESYVRNALFLCLNLLGDFESSIAHGLLQRDFEAWRQHIIYGAQHLHRLPLPYHIPCESREELELQVLSLLYELLYSSGDNPVNRKKRFHKGLLDLTPLDNLILYGLSCGVRTPIPHRFGTFNPSRLHKAFSRSRIFVKVANDNHIHSASILQVDVWSSYLIRSLPIAFPNLVLSPNPYSG